MRLTPAPSSHDFSLREKRLRRPKGVKGPSLDAERTRPYYPLQRDPPPEQGTERKALKQNTMNTNNNQQSNAVPYEGRLYKPFAIDTGYYKCQVILTIQQYRNGSLAVEALVVEDGNVVDIFGVLTVNLCHGLQDDKRAFVDTNNCPYAPDFLLQNGIAKPTGVYGQSGFCSYPLYEWDTSKFYPENK